VIETRRAQRSFGDGLIAAEMADLHEAWMRQADRALDDPQIVAVVHEALTQQHPQSRLRGRRGVPAEVVLRLLVLKHARRGPIWCIATSPASAAPRRRMPRPWAAGAWRWGRQ
jgi:hypothetical protein